MISKLRRFLWRVLGIDYNHMIRVVDMPYLKNDNFTTLGEGKYDNNALAYRWSDAPLVIGSIAPFLMG